MTIRKRRQVQARVWWGLVLVCAVLAAIPIQSGITRAILVFGTFGAWALGLFFFWRMLVCRVLFLLPLLAVILLAMIPNRIANVDQLRRAYVDKLRHYEGTRYLWGGEGPFGIDCSGLVRRGLIDASFAEGWRTKDFSLLRTGAALWWYDASAEALGHSYQGRTRYVGMVPSLNTMELSRLLPGDLAVTLDGKHVLAYLGASEWIEADPKAGKVITVRTPSTDIWFDQPMNIVRWYRF